MPIKTELRKVTPAWAGEILDRHYERLNSSKFNQRRVSQAAINRYAQDMALGNWRSTPIPIIFDTNDNLTDGQQRLEAVRKSGKTIEMYVSTGNEPEIIDVIDTGRPRDIAAMLRVHGWKYCPQFTASLRSFCHVACGTRRISMTYSIAQYILDKLDVKTAIEKIMAQSSSGTNYIHDFRAFVVGPLAYYWTTKPKKATEFAESYFQFNTTKGSAVQALLNWTKGSRTRNEVRVEAVCSAIRRWDENESVEQIKPSHDAMEWLANQNPTLREKIRKLTPRNK